MAVVELHSPDELVPLVHAALRAWHTVGTADNLLEGLLLIQEERGSITASTSPTAMRLATNRVLLAGIEELESGDQLEAEILRMRFADGNTLMMVANRINASEHTVSRVQRAAIVSLSNVLYEKEMDARHSRAQSLQQKLPPPSYSQLFGVEEAEELIVERLSQSDGPGVVSIVGIGGIGKTALADAVTRQLAGRLQFDGVVWLRIVHQTLSGRKPSPKITFDNLLIQLADGLGLNNVDGNQEQRLVQIRRALTDRPNLIVIDNLETDGETAFILDHLNDLAQPSKFLLTTRTRHATQAAVFHHELRELKLDAAASLVTSHARDVGLPEIDQFGAEHIQHIYEITGGNPLALKIVVSLLDLLPLSQVLYDLKVSRPGLIEDLYSHIYWQAWRVLSPEARSLLQAMPLVGETGGLPDYLQEISNLTDNQFWPALQELRSRSLIEIRGTVHEKRYGVHRLTESFLRTEIIHWPDK